MKKLICFLTWLTAFPLFSLTQPILLGTAKRGGASGTGTIITYTVSSGNLAAPGSFEKLESSGTCKLLLGSDGKIYGTNYYGLYGYGGIYSFDPPTATYTQLFDFNGTNGSNPWGLIQSVNGRFYGTTANGGGYNSPNGNGVLYSYDPQTNAFSKLVDFDGTKGAYPTGLVEATNGKLYGTTANGGSSNNGTLFSFDPGTAVYEKLKDFDATNGSRPTGRLLQAANGLLYGMTESGGKWNRGIIYSFSPVTKAFVKLIDFDGTNGTNPTLYGSLVQASDGKLYGMTNAGGSSNVGVIFSFDPATNECKSIKDFNGADGSRPYCDLVQLNNGKLYGLTNSGGASNSGIIFSLDPLTNNFIKEKEFDGLTGGGPLGNLVQLSDGQLYGASGKNSTGYGNIFSFDPANGSYAVGKTFGLNNNGSFASAGFVKASDGKFYATTIDGGHNGLGIIFAFDPGNNSYTRLADFDGISGSKPYGALVQASNGKLYGMTSTGGSNNLGVIYSFDPSGNSYTKLKDFDGGMGATPYGTLLQAGNGKLYGMTNKGGNGNAGVLFSFDLTTLQLVKLKDFGGVDGANPYGNLVQAGNGKLYGMTYGGGSSNLGVIFSFDPTTNAYSKIKDFTGGDGANPYGSLVQASNGKLYGMTLTGGKTTVKGTFGNSFSNYGVIFSLDPANNTYTKLKDFDGTGGANPNGSLIKGSNDKLYGMTSGGGSNGKGVVFSFDPASKNSYVKLKDFDGVNGANPSYGAAFVEVGSNNSVPVTHATNTLPADFAEKAINRVVVYPNPFTTQATIRFSATETASAMIEVFNVQGERVRVENMGVLQKGTLYQSKVNLFNLAAGTYLYQVTNGSYRERGMLLKKE